MNPVTSGHVRRRAAPVMGLVPTSPTTAEACTSVMPYSDRIVKLPADPRFTGIWGVAAVATPVEAASIEMMAMGMIARVFSLKIVLKSSNTDMRGETQD